MVVAEANHLSSMKYRPPTNREIFHLLAMLLLGVLMITGAATAASPSEGVEQDDIEKNSVEELEREGRMGTSPSVANKPTH
jgi:hypothetical protein